ncbi:MAG: VOC family protein [Gammaproteobacteria bacterium]
MNDLHNQSVSPIRVAGIDHVVIRIVDLERMLQFYCDVLGCNVERRQDGIGLIQLRAGDALIDLVPVDGKLGAQGGAAPGPEGRNMDHLCLRLEKFDGAAIIAFLEDIDGPYYGLPGLARPHLAPQVCRLPAPDRSVRHLP